MSNANYPVFKFNGEFFVFSLDQMSVLKITKSDYSYLKNVASTYDSTSPRLIEIFDKYSLTRGNTIQSTTQGSDIPPFPITNIALFVTQSCNLNCVYCYGDNAHYGETDKNCMDLATAYTAVDWLVKVSNTQQRITISFFGGEPLLNFELIKQVVKYSLAIGAKSGKIIDFDINTNGTLITEEVIEFFDRHRFRVIVSIDGPKEVQDIQRPFKAGLGSYDEILPNIRALLRALPDTSCRAVLIGNSNVSTIRNSLIALGFRKIMISYCSFSLFESDKGLNLGRRRALSQIRMEVEKEALSLYNAIITRDIETILKIKNSGFIYTRFERLINGQKKLFPCGAGRSSVAVSCVGDIYLCHRLVGMCGFKLGNVNSEVINRLKYQVSPVERIELCKKCYAKYLCAGGCYHDNLGYSGSIRVPSKDMCKLMKYLVAKLVYVHSMISDEDISYLRRHSLIQEKICPFDF